MGIGVEARQDCFNMRVDAPDELVRGWDAVKPAGRILSSGLSETKLFNLQ